MLAEEEETKMRGPMQPLRADDETVFYKRTEQSEGTLAGEAGAAQEEGCDPI